MNGIQTIVYCSKVNYIYLTNIWMNKASSFECDELSLDEEELKSCESITKSWEVMSAP